MVPCETNDEHPALLDEVGVEVFVSESGARGMERRVGEIQIRHRYNGGQVETRDLGGDREFRRWHQVGPYARHLGYSPKSLDRSCRAAAAMTAKRVIVERILHEAKRLLAHSQLPVASISHQLGFDEAPNFVKYLKRETGTTPNQLRARLRSDKPT